TKAIDVDLNASTFHADAVTVDGQPIAYTNARLRATGIADIDLFGFVSGQITFSFETTKVDVDLVGGSHLVGADLTLLSLTVQNLFVGVPDGVGFRVTTGSLYLAALKPAAPAGTDTRSWLALTATMGGVSFTGVDGLTLQLS